MYLYSLSLIFFTTLAAAVYPITFSIPEEKIVISVPQKEWDFAPLVPGDLSTYIYDDEESYRKDYQKSYYAFTKIKGGADCLRHYEILANGCIPYFTDLEQVHPMTMTHFPKELVKEAMDLPGVEAGRIDHAIFDKKRYFEILEKLLQHTRKHLTCRKMAQYVLEKIGKPNPPKVLFLSHYPYPDYMREMSYIGFKLLLKDRCDFYPKMDYLYQDYNQPTEKLFKKGFSYTKILAPQEEIARSDMWSNLKKGAYDLVVIGSIHRVPLSWIRVMNRLGVEIVSICGEDFDRTKNYHDCCFRELDHLFVREYTSILS